jgi:TldD protein
MQSRRRFLQTAGAATALAWLPSLSYGATRIAHQGTILIPSMGRWADPDLRALADRAVDAAMAAGARYADVRLTLDRKESITAQAQPGIDDEWHGVGVRVYVDGYWGFMGSGVWTNDEMVRLAQGAVAQARANGAGVPKESTLGAPPPVVNGEWHMPVKYDPFDVPKGEKMDLMLDMHHAISEYSSMAWLDGGMQFTRQQKVFASSDGSRWAQTTYVTGWDLSVGYQGQYSLQVDMGFLRSHLLTPAGKGWEYILEANLIDHIPELVADAEQRRFVTPVEINRYDVVLSAQAVATLVAPTIGAATELDRALGYEANATGTSYLSEPLEMVGQYKIGSPLLNVTADRTKPGALATVKWDDESIAVEPFPLVKNGILVDYQTTREHAANLAPYYQKTGQAVRSRGCANAESALFITTQHTSNLRVNPGAEELSFDDLVKNTERGVAAMSLYPSMDQQQLNGMAMGEFREIRNGKLGRFITGAGFLFRSPEFWRNLVAVGGPKSEVWFGFSRTRGQPEQSAMHSVGAVPAKVTNVGIVDAYRKA